MIIIPPGSETPLRADVVVRVVLRSDLTPVPQTVELEVRDVEETAAMVEGAVCRVGRDLTPFRLVKQGGQAATGLVSGSRPTGAKTFIGMIDSCAPVAQPRQGAVVAYGGTLGGAYRACGARVAVDGDIPAPVFVCLRGMTPSFELAKLLQEAGGAVVVSGPGKLSFKRLRDLEQGEPVREIERDSAESNESDFLERHLVPFAISTDAAGAILLGRSESGRGVVYRPRATVDTLNNLSLALITRRKARSIFSPDIMAGDVVLVSGERYIVVTAAHVFSAGGAGADGEQATHLWLGQVAA